MASSNSFTAFGYTITVFKVPYRGKATTCQVDYRTVVAGSINAGGPTGVTVGTSATNKELTVTIPAGGTDVGGYLIMAAVRPA